MLAAFLGLLVVGLGHLYLRRWLRGVGWAALVVAVGAVFVPDDALASLGTGAAVDPVVLAPVLTVVTVSAADAFVVALRAADDASSETDETDKDVATCPECGESVDPDLDFCQWCTAELPDER